MPAPPQVLWAAVFVQEFRMNTVQSGTSKILHVPLHSGKFRALFWVLLSDKLSLRSFGLLLHFMVSYFRA